MECKVCVTYQDLDLIVTIKDFDYYKGEPGSWDEPSIPPEVELIDGTVAFDGVYDAAEFDAAVAALMQEDNAALFVQLTEDTNINNTLVEACFDCMDAKFQEEADDRAEYLYDSRI